MPALVNNPFTFSKSLGLYLENTEKILRIMIALLTKSNKRAVFHKTSKNLFFITTQTVKTIIYFNISYLSEVEGIMGKGGETAEFEK